MAHSPKVKAAACADLLSGATVREVAARHKVGLGTVSAWSDELKTERNRTEPNKTEHRDAAFKRELEGLLMAMAKAPRRILERIANGEAEALSADSAEALATLLNTATDTGIRLLQAAAVILDARAERSALPAPEQAELP